VQALLELWKRVQAKKPEASTLFWNVGYTAPLSKVQLERTMRALMIQAGVPCDYTPYSIKHAAITHLLANNIQEWIVNRNARLSQFSNTATRHYFVGQANQIASRAIAAAGTDRIQAVSSSTDEILEREPQGKELSAQTAVGETPIISQGFQNFPPWNVLEGLPLQNFESPKGKLEGIELVRSSETEEEEEDISVFLSVCSMLSSFRSDEADEAHDQPKLRRSERLRQKQPRSACSSHAGLVSHAPDQPPMTPNSGSLVQ
jgi:hypothetical protein